MQIASMLPCVPHSKNNSHCIGECSFRSFYFYFLSLFVLVCCKEKAFIYFQLEFFLPKFDYFVRVFRIGKK